MGAPRIYERPVLELARHGCTSAEVARRLRISTKSACNVLKRYADAGILFACGFDRGNGRPATVWRANA